MNPPENPQDWGLLKHLGLLALIGLIVGLGQMLAEQGKITRRAALGRCMTSAGMGVCAGAALSWVPHLSLVAQCGLAAAIASLGTSGITALFQRLLNK